MAVRQGAFISISLALSFALVWAPLTSAECRAPTLSETTIVSPVDGEVMPAVVETSIDGGGWETTLLKLLEALRTGTLCSSPMLHVWNNVILQKNAADRRDRGHRGQLDVCKEHPAVGCKARRRARRDPRRFDRQRQARAAQRSARFDRRGVQGHDHAEGRGHDRHAAAPGHVRDGAGNRRARRRRSAHNVKVTLTSVETGTFAIKGQKSTMTGPSGQLVPII